MWKTNYTLTIFKDKHKMGETLKNVYKRLPNAEQKFINLVNSGAFECVVLRRNEVSTHGSEISSPIKIWGTK